jgi:hypothetical protein
MSLSLRFLLLLPSLAGCAGAPAKEVAAARAPRPEPRASAPQSTRHDDFFEELERERAQLGAWLPGQILMQGFIGVGYPDDLTFESGGGGVEIDADELDDLPVIGGGAQLKLAGERIDFGVEGMLSFAFRSDLLAFASGGGGAVVAVDVDVYVFDLYGGPFLSTSIGERTRVYAAAGPILRFLEYSQDDEGTVEEEDEDGFGSGVYARGGIEFMLPSGTLVGFGARWSSAEVELGDFGDSDLEDVQLVITVTRGT